MALLEPAVVCPAHTGVVFAGRRGLGWGSWGTCTGVVWLRLRAGTLQAGVCQSSLTPVQGEIK